MYAVNQLPKQSVAKSPTHCCPRFKPDAWDGQTFRFENKLFMKITTRSFLHIPLNMGSAMKKAMQTIDRAGAGSDDQHLMLSYEYSPWKAEHFIAVTKPVPGAHMGRLSGTYLAKVFEGPFRNAGTWYHQLVKYVASKGYNLHKAYFCYTTCPKCAKVYGKNYVIGFAQIDD